MSWAWKALEPGGSHRPMPESVCRAFVALACAWGWHDVAVAILIGFFGMMRPGEILKLQSKDFVFPIKGITSVWAMFIRIALPKMRRLAARREHIRIDEPTVIAYTKSWVNDFAPDAFVFFNQASPPLLPSCGFSLATFSPYTLP